MITLGKVFCNKQQPNWCALPGICNAPALTLLQLLGTCQASPGLLLPRAVPVRQAARSDSSCLLVRGLRSSAV